MMSYVMDLIYSMLSKSFRYLKEKLVTYDFLIMDILVLQHKEDNTAINPMKHFS
jgi:hypothetical protein